MTTRTRSRLFVVEASDPKGIGVYTVGEFRAHSKSDAIGMAKAKLQMQGNADMTSWSFEAWTAR